jgi:hypothetical protein
MAKKQSGQRVTELASAILRDGYLPTEAELRSLAASILAQRETPMKEGDVWAPAEKKSWWNPFK